MNGMPRTHRPELDALQARFALRIAARLSERCDALPHDIGERLRVAREQAVARALRARLAQPAATGALQVSGRSQGGVASLAGGPGGPLPSPWWRVASVLPLMVLVLGLLTIGHLHEQAEIRAAADVDADLLADDLPPEAYRDPGFVTYLKQAEP